MWRGKAWRGRAGGRQVGGYDREIADAALLRYGYCLCVLRFPTRLPLAHVPLLLHPLPRPRWSGRCPASTSTWCSAVRIKTSTYYYSHFIYILFLPPPPPDRGGAADARQARARGALPAEQAAAQAVRGVHGQRRDAEEAGDGRIPGHAELPHVAAQGAGAAGTC